MSAAQRRFRAGLAVAATSIVPAIGLAVAWRWADARAAEPTRPAAPDVELAGPSVETDRSDLLTFRRTPGPIAERAAAQATVELAAPLVERLGGGSCAIATADGETIAAANPDLALPSAASQQLLVAAVALDVLGPDFRFRTEVRAASIADGVVHGDVYLVGGGDPSLVTSAHLASLATPPRLPTVVDPLADAVAAAGIVAVTGNIVGDGTRYDDEFAAPSWTQAVRAGAPPYDALLLDDGRLDGGGVGLNPSQAAASRFNRLLAQRGISVAGRNRNAPTPVENTASVAVVESAPLVDIVADLLVTADPATAELLLKEVGHAVAGSGTRQAGLDAVRSTLASWGVPLDGFVADDGSGLSDAGRVSCRTLAAVVAHAGLRSPLATALPTLATSATAGEGFVARAPAAVRAHDARRTDLHALTGLVAAGSETVAFSVVLAEPGAHDEAVFAAVRDALVDVLVGHPAGPTAASLAPR